MALLPWLPSNLCPAIAIAAVNLCATLNINCCIQDIDDEQSRLLLTSTFIFHARVSHPHLCRLRPCPNLQTLDEIRDIRIAKELSYASRSGSRHSQTRQRCWRESDRWICAVTKRQHANMDLRPLIVRLIACRLPQRQRCPRRHQLCGLCLQ